MNSTPKTSIQELWQEQPLEGIRMSAEEVRRKATRFEKRVYWRNAREYVAGCIAIAGFAYFFVRMDNSLLRIAFAMIIVGVAYVMFQLFRKGATRTLPAAQTAEQCAQFFRSELERQRDLIGDVWSWYIGPVIPGFVMLTIGSAIANPRASHLVILGILDVLTAAFFVFVAKLNSRAARSLQRQIDELEASNHI